MCMCVCVLCILYTVAESEFAWFIVNNILTCRFFDNGCCDMRCQVGRYPMGRQCHLCHYTCHECTDEGPDNCTSCDRGTLTQIRIWKTVKWQKKSKLVKVKPSKQSYIWTFPSLSFLSDKTCTFFIFLEVTPVALCSGLLKIPFI